MTCLLTGRVIAGIGIGSSFIGLDWVKKQIIEKLGFEPYAGTLNLEIDEETSGKYENFKQIQKGIIIEPVSNEFYQGKCFRIIINDNINGAIVIPLIPNYPKNKIEIIASVNLRDTLRLENGSEITIQILDV